MNEISFGSGVLTVFIELKGLQLLVHFGQGEEIVYYFTLSNPPWSLVGLYGIMRSSNSHSRLYRVIPCSVIPYRVIPNRAIPYRVIRYRVMPYRVIPYSVIRYRVMA
ncbi:hypothetical protein Btru_043665 [Bulinus truncatus]|nr:hypothetical protein Btru_043665 [Bulinus truncatus]